MASDKNHFITFSADVKVDGIKIPAVDISVTYALNQVPEAAIRLAVGRSKSGPSNAMGVLSRADHMSSLVVTVNQQGSPFRNGEQTIFNGFVAGPRNDATADQSVGAMVDGVGFLHELQLGNKLSWLLHQSSPAPLFQPALTTPAQGGNTVTLDNRINVTGIENDVWNNGMLKVFNFLAKDGSLVAFGMKGQSNARAMAALSKIKTDPTAPLAINKAAGTGDPGQFMSKGIAQHLCSVSSGVSFWDTILSFSSLWSMALVPRVNDALIVPFIEASRSVYKNIKLSETFSFTSLNNIQRANCRGVLLVGARQAPPQGGVGMDMGWLGVALAEDLGMSGTDTGQIKAYQWPEAYGAAVVPNSATLNIPKISNNIRSVNNPRGNVPPSAASDYKTYNLPAFMTKVAEARLRRELLTGRMCTVTGPFRTDICPGSTVGVELIGEEDEGLMMFGVVSSVQFNINAEQPMVSTTFTISHLRTLATQMSAAVSNAHPVFGTTFKGATLVE